MIGKAAASSSRPLLVVVLLAGVLVLALGLRLQGLDRTGFWGDEAHTAARGESLRAVVINRRCAPLYAVTYVVFLFAKGEIPARLPHALAGAASIYLLYRIASRRLGDRTGLLAAFLLAISPFHLHHSRDARYYSLMVLFTLVALDSLERALRGGGRAWLLVFAAASLINLHNHPFAAIPVAAFCVYGLWTWRRERGPALSTAAPARRRTWASRAALLAAGAAALACLVYNLRPGIWRAFFRRIAGEGAGRFGLEIDLESVESALIWFGAGPGLALPIYVSCFACGAVVLALRGRQVLVLVALVFGATCAALLFAIWIDLSHPFNLRYLLYLLPFYLLVVAAGAEAIAGWLAGGVAAAAVRWTGRPRPALAGPWFRWLPVLAAAAVFATLAAPAIASYQGYQLAGYRAAAALLSKLSSPGDAIAMPAYRVHGHATGLRWYLRRERPGALSPLVIVGSREEAEALAARHGRLWLVEIVPAPLQPGSDGLRDWAAERLDEAGRLPGKVWNDRLGPPQVMEEIVIRRLP